jgi:hypothetical protein
LQLLSEPKEHVMSTRNSSFPAPFHHGHQFNRRATHPHVDLDAADAFVPDYRHGFVRFDDDDAEALGEEFVSAATSAEAVGEDARDEVGGTEELGGMTIETILEDEREV